MSGEAAQLYDELEEGDANPTAHFLPRLRIFKRKGKWFCRAGKISNRFKYRR
jgi:hypothetical protein